MAEPDSKRSGNQRTGNRKTGPRPISRHPLFPAIVALWFAALLGMGSLALSTSLLERLVIASHVDSLIPAAAPPLGTTARLMLALALGVPAGLAGWMLARRLAAPERNAGPQVFNVAEADLGAQPQWPGMAEASSDTEAPSYAEPSSYAEAGDFAEPAPSLDPSRLIALPADRVAEDMAPVPPAQATVEQEVIAARPAPAAAQRILSADLSELSHLQLVERLALALQRREELMAAAFDEPAEAVSPVLHFPDLADRRNARLMPPTPQSRAMPQETEKALRAALAQLERLSGTG